MGSAAPARWRRVMKTTRTSSTVPPGELSFHDSDTGADALAEISAAGSNQGSRLTRAQRLGLTALAVCPILTAGIGLVSISRLSSVPGTARRIIEPGQPRLGRGFPVGRRRGPVLSRARNQHSEPVRAERRQRASRPTEPRVVLRPAPAPSSPAHSEHTTSTRLPAQRGPTARAGSGEFVLGGR